MISIIVPVLNEESVIERLLKSLPYGENIEVIIVDAESHDRTLDIARRYPVQIIHSPRGRALQMNAGAKAARGDVLLFLHADCCVDESGLKALEKYTALNFIGGCFTHKIDSPKWIYRGIETTGHWRALVSKVFYGDQAIFVRRDIFQRIGGFDLIPLFEDAVFSKKLSRRGKTVVLDYPATVLPRRWEKNGIVKTTLLNWLLTTGFILGISTDRLAKFYKNVR